MIQNTEHSILSNIQRALERRKEKNILSEYFYMTLSLISEISTLPKHIQADINLEIMFPESKAHKYNQKVCFWTSSENNTGSLVWIGAVIRWTISNQWYITSMGRHSSVNYFDSLNLLKRYSEPCISHIRVPVGDFECWKVSRYLYAKISFRNLSKYFPTNFNFLLSLATEYILFLNRLNYTFPLQTSLGYIHFIHLREFF